MNVFPIEPKFEIGTKGFDDVDDNGNKLDLLNRGEFGKRLTDLVDRTEQPLVIALDGPWGSGKSHFLKLWAGAHKLELGGKAEVIYFDAFEHDFLDDPLVSLVAKLAKDAPAKGLAKTAIKKMKDAAAPLARFGVGLAITAGTSGAELLLGPVGDAVAAKVGQTAEKRMEEFWKAETTRIDAMEGFRNALTALTMPTQKGGDYKKIVFIIDELDRCRPDYALQMLEIIKHFFTVPNVHFVLGANLSELENSVRARYGEKIAARKYLQKFVMLEMRLPKSNIARDPSIADVEEYFEQVKHHYQFNADLRSDFTSQLKLLRNREGLSIRDVQRVLSLISLFPRAGAYRNGSLNSLLVSVAFLAVLESTLYRGLRYGNSDFLEIARSLNIERSDANYWSHGMWHILAVYLKADEYLPADKFAAADLVHIKQDMARHFGPSSATILPEAIARYFDTFTLPTP